SRFISPDPIIQEPDNPQTFNRYSYVVNNPVKYIDPSGFDSLDDFFLDTWNLFSSIFSPVSYGSSVTSANSIISVTQDALSRQASGCTSTGVSGCEGISMYPSIGVQRGDGWDCTGPGGACQLELRRSASEAAGSSGTCSTCGTIGSGGGKTSAPGFWEGMIPIWGSGKQAINDFEQGKWGWGTFNTAMAVSDVFLVKAAGSAVGKGIWKFGSHTWPATSKWLTNTGWREFAGQPMHHWMIPQNEWGTYIPNAIKNQPWNVMGMPDHIFHNAVHGLGENAFGPIGRLWYGTPGWFKAGTFSTLGRAANTARGDEDCGCD
ncbi:MAG TPA: RHS repeat-associated core domain-containing protein, partial [Verrucomicrobiae bacterium]|nr:RHS repeat-associated core domain-containing protein [Verrucomicrobiae bacterium]